MTRRAIALLFAIALFGSACGAEDPPGYVDPQSALSPSQTGTGDPSATDKTETGSGSQNMSVSVDPLGSPTTCHETVAIQGTATPGSDVYALGGSSTSDIGSAHPQTGRFCIDVPLRRNDVNQIEVWAKHPELGPAEPAKITVTHDASATGCSTSSAPAQTAPTTPSLTNVALGAKVTSKHTPKEHSNARVTDGDDKTWASWGGGDWWNPVSDYDGWVMVTLGQMAEVSKVVIRWRDRKGSGDKYATKYRFYYATMNTEKFDEHDGTWIMPPGGDIKSGDGGEDTFTLKGEPVRAVAVRMLQDGGQSYNENFAISEIKVLADLNRASTPVVPTRPGTCSTIGGL